MRKYLKGSDFYVTDDVHFMEKEHAITEDLSYWINRMHVDVAKGKSGTADRLIKLINKHPKNPQVKNLLTSYYIQTNQRERAYELNRKTMEAHPTYFFAKLNLANEYLSEDNFEKVLEVLGENFSLKELYPERDTFHVSEALLMNKFAVIYHSRLRNFEIASDFLKKMEEIDRDDEECEIAKEILDFEVMRAAQERFDAEQASRIRVPAIDQVKTTKIEKPIFNHPEVEMLYTNEINMNSELLEELLRLQRQTLIEDLCTVLNDGIERYSYFEDLSWDEENTSFVLHAINLLTELEAENALPSVLNVLRQSEDLVEFYLGDLITEYVWMCIYKLGANQLNVLENFMKESNVHTYCKTEVSVALTQIVLHHPERRDEVIDWFRRVFDFYQKASIEDDVIDSDLIGLMVAYVDDFKGLELLPEIRELFKLGYVAYGICGDLEELEDAMKTELEENQKNKVLSIYEIYEDIASNSLAHQHEMSYEIPIANEERIVPILPVTNGPKIGRNDPCPCGSGKKYKKCCMD